VVLPEGFQTAIKHSDELHFKPHRLAGQRVVEVEQHRAVFAHLAHGTGIAAQSIGGGELHHVTRGVLLVRITEFVEQLARHPLHHVGLVLTEGLARCQIDGGADPSSRPIRRCSMAGDSWPLPMLSVAGWPSKVSIMTCPSGPDRR
jgi:hypothetical protein